MAFRPLVRAVDLLTVHTRLGRAGRTSMDVEVCVTAEPGTPQGRPWRWRSRA
ncbi:hotdog domain-containing protein [Streptomyces sp. NPDC058000]|uniref:hotdog domain-containing protein n=1 Tax=Streptomyces sp. NPDC058000 TaxID=3346299 RepID=UPI0036E1D5A9